MYQLHNALIYLLRIMHLGYLHVNIYVHITYKLLIFKLANTSVDVFIEFIKLNPFINRINMVRTR